MPVYSFGLHHPIKFDIPETMARNYNHIVDEWFQFGNEYEIPSWEENAPKGYVRYFSASLGSIIVEDNTFFIDMMREFDSIFLKATEDYYDKHPGMFCHSAEPYLIRNPEPRPQPSNPLAELLVGFIFAGVATAIHHYKKGR